MRVSVVLSLRRKVSRLDKYTVPQHVFELMPSAAPPAIGKPLNVTMAGVLTNGHLKQCLLVLLRVCRYNRIARGRRRAE
jgi:hypothetical protein